MLILKQIGCWLLWKICLTPILIFGGVVLVLFWFCSVLHRFFEFLETTLDDFMTGMNFNKCPHFYFKEQYEKCKKLKNKEEQGHGNKTSNDL
jgi:hypothetical protein